MTNLLLKLFVKNHKNTTSPVVREAVGKLASIVSIVCNVILSVAKILVGALLVAVVACVPMLAAVISLPFTKAFPTSLFASATANLNFIAFGGSSLMIVVGVALETTRELEAQMSLRNYKGFLD